jgi:Protein of unknown function DUF262/Protein of unknown function (DUF1524)
VQPNRISPLAMFSPPLQYLVPIFQRGYVWTLEKQVRTLWSNITDRAEEVAQHQRLLAAARASGGAHMVRTPRKHFLGTVITSEHQAAVPGQPESTEVIDGQQRITTMQLLALAFRDAVASVEDEFLRKSLNAYTLNEGVYRQPHYRFKVWPTNAGREELTAIIAAESAQKVCERFPIRTSGKGRSKQHEPRPLMVEAYLYFYGVISMFIRGKDSAELSPVQDELEQLLIDVDIYTDRTWSDRWIHAIRHLDSPVPPFSDLPILPERIVLLLGTLNDYLQVIELRLEHDDDAQVIFESLNALGERLTAADLVRNFVFLQAARQSLLGGDLYRQYWQPFDECPAETGARSKHKLFWKVEERQGRLTHPRLDALLYHYVSMRTREDVKLDHVFEEFKTWWTSSERDLSRELGAFKAASELYRALVLPDRTTALGRFAYNLRALDTSTAMPVVLLLGERLGTEQEEFLTCLRYIESYVVRRAVCGMTTKAYNRIFPGLVAALCERDTRPADTVSEYLSELQEVTQEWPSDAEFRRAWTENPTYRVLRPGRTRMLLEALELGLRNNRHHETPNLPTETLHVEHVLPQAWQEHWALSEGTPEAISFRETRLHNIGNLTLLTEKLNPALRNHTFRVKRPQITRSLLALNSYFQDPKWAGDGAAWNESAIMKRAESLFEVALKLWPHQ